MSMNVLELPLFGLAWSLRSVSSTKISNVPSSYFLMLAVIVHGFSGSQWWSVSQHHARTAHLTWKQLGLSMVDPEPSPNH